MPHPQAMSMLRILAGLSWSDGVLAESERANLERLIGATALDDDERASASAWLSEAVVFDEKLVADLSENQRLATYQAAVRLAIGDLDLAEAERAFLEELRQALNIDADTAREIADGVSRPTG